MCIGIPMQVEVVDGVYAKVLGRGQRKYVKTLLAGRVRAGDWVLVHLDDAREKISAERAREVNATLNMLDMVLQSGGISGDEPGRHLGKAVGAGQARSGGVNDFDAFALPSNMDPQRLKQWSGAAVSSEKAKGDSV